MHALILLLCLLALPASATTLVVAMEDANNKPFEYIDENTELTGFHVEVMRAVAQRLGWNLDFKRFPWKRTLRALERGEVQAVSYIASSAEREAYARFHPGNLLHVSRMALFIKRSRADEIRFEPPLEAMAGRWRIAVPGGYLMSDELMDMLARGVPIEQPTVNQSQLFIMLVSGRFDIVLGFSNALILGQADAPGLAQQVQRLEQTILPGKRMYLAFSRQAPAELAERFAEAYRQFRQQPEYLALAERFEIGEMLPQPQEFP
ncbi:substrate-binding periplasmic protein [Pseudomonas zhanjiangensis]|uniref:Substrate-binding periplasmic protein n=1 Tax=Pseudomonas zhanjiangensis TaxID=3239015 RepID=A0ABV3YRA0_9PSED